MAYRAFYSFHYKPDNWRAATVRNIGAIEGNKPASGQRLGDRQEGWGCGHQEVIADQMKGRSCIVVLVGTNTAGRKWINHEIIKSWNDGMGVVGIYIHGLQNSDKKVSTKGKNPFASIGYGKTEKKLSSIVKCYDPAGLNSQERYDWIKEHLANAVAEANKIRRDN